MDLTKLFPESKNDTKRKPVFQLQGVATIALLMAVLVLVCVFMVKYSGNLVNRIDDLVEENKELSKMLEEERKIDVTYVGNKLESIGELATAKLTYNGIIHFEEGKIPLLTKKEFWLAYRVSLKAGFNLEHAEIIVTENIVTINLPEAEIYEPNVDEKSFQFFDKNFGIFAHEEMDDLTQAIYEAKADALAQPETQEMKDRAEEQAVLLLTALLEGQIGERDLVINIG